MTWMARWGFWGAVGALIAPVALGGWLLVVDGPATGGTIALGSAGGIQVARKGAPFDSLVGVARRLAPFRIDGRPSRVAYDPMRSEAPISDYVPPKPALVVSGVVDGAVPLVVLEGIPGRDGPVLLAVGDTVAGLKVRRIKGGQVTITGMDTTWVLSIRGLP